MGQNFEHLTESSSDAIFTRQKVAGVQVLPKDIRGTYRLRIIE